MQNPKARTHTHSAKRRLRHEGGDPHCGGAAEGDDRQLVVAVGAAKVAPHPVLSERDALVCQPDVRRGSNGKPADLIVCFFCFIGEIEFCDLHGRFDCWVQNRFGVGFPGFVSKILLASLGNSEHFCRCAPSPPPNTKKQDRFINPGSTMATRTREPSNRFPLQGIPGHPRFSRIPGHLFSKVRSRPWTCCGLPITYPGSPCIPCKQF